MLLPNLIMKVKEPQSTTNIICKKQLPVTEKSYPMKLTHKGKNVNAFLNMNWTSNKWEKK